MMRCSSVFVLALAIAACRGQTQSDGSPGTKGPSGSGASGGTSGSLANGGGRGGQGVAAAGGSDGTNAGASVGGAAGPSPVQADAASLDVIREMPPGGEIVDGPSMEVPSSPWMKDYSGYAEEGPVHESGTPGEGHCEQCADNSEEWCLWNRGRQVLSCGVSLSGLPDRGSCLLRPKACTADCPIVCGCDGKLYCNACIANAWGTDRSTYGCEGSPWW
jgi:hypothetical protein